MPSVPIPINLAYLCELGNMNIYFDLFYSAVDKNIEERLWSYAPFCHPLAHLRPIFAAKT